MNRVFAKNDEDLRCYSLIFGVSRRDASSGKIYQAPPSPLSLSSSVSRMRLRDRRSFPRARFFAPVETCFERITATERIRASRKSLSHSFSLRNLHDLLHPKNLPCINEYPIIPNEYINPFSKNRSTTLRSILHIFFSNLFEKGKEREKSNRFSSRCYAQRETEREIRRLTKFAKERETRGCWEILVERTDSTSSVHLLLPFHLSPLSLPRRKPPLEGGEGDGTKNHREVAAGRRRKRARTGVHLRGEKARRERREGGRGRGGGGG